MDNKKKEILSVFGFVVFWFLGGLCLGQELNGPNKTLPGTIAVFEISPAQEADWFVFPETAESFVVDSSRSRLYFATPKKGEFTVVAAISVDNVPKLLSAQILNGDSDPEPDPGPNPEPNPEPKTELSEWIRANVAVVQSDAKAAEITALADAFSAVVKKINSGVIKTPANAQTQTKVSITEGLALVNDSALNVWEPFIKGLSDLVAKNLGGGNFNLEDIKKIYLEINTTLKAQVILLEKKQKESIENVTKESVKQLPTTVKKKEYSRVCNEFGCFIIEK